MNNTQENNTQNPLEWRSVDVGDGVRIRYGLGGAGNKTVLLIHGYPETVHAWRKVVGPLMDSQCRIIALDVRGAGGSSRPMGGYDKATLAEDCLKVLDHAGITEPVCVVGHDIGMMIAYAFAWKFPSRLDRLVVMESPLPGTKAYEAVRQDDSRVWHFHFHQAPDIPEGLTAGKERFYLERFWHDLAYDAGAIDQNAKNVYLESFSQPGAMRAGFELYRAFPKDAVDNQNALEQHGKLKLPVLALFGESSGFDQTIKNEMQEVADDVVFVNIPKAAHWIPEENPKAFVQAVLSFLRSA
ncbi:alpha/beta fold hydrolase [Terribacillus saccharophilus]|uniref:alpha/beta fold hydrolase n=1 Tax=Terribacillus saccharophilus TaxID=361277 RepID=UPI002DCD19F6|nr:alpha/beta hydrolase [Terribacillus saccharophilus]